MEIFPVKGCSYRSLQLKKNQIKAVDYFWYPPPTPTPPSKIPVKYFHFNKGNVLFWRQCPTTLHSSFIWYHKAQNFIPLRRHSHKAKICAFWKVFRRGWCTKLSRQVAETDNSKHRELSLLLRLGKRGRYLWGKFLNSCLSHHICSGGKRGQALPIPS